MPYTLPVAPTAWKIATPADFQALAEELSGRDLDALFDEWVYGE
jgi:aminopeptidase N